MHIVIVSYNGLHLKRKWISSDAINKPEFHCTMSFGNSKESLLMWLFQGNFLKKEQRAFSKENCSLVVCGFLANIHYPRLGDFRIEFLVQISI